MCVVWDRKGVIGAGVQPLAIIKPIVKGRLFFQPRHVSHCSSPTIVPDENRGCLGDATVHIPHGLKRQSKLAQPTTWLIYTQEVLELSRLA
jgi:hypothetical protein